jgi:hypothetical protein
MCTWAAANGCTILCECSFDINCAENGFCELRCPDAGDAGDANESDDAVDAADTTPKDAADDEDAAFERKSAVEQITTARMSGLQSA